MSESVFPAQLSAPDYKPYAQALAAAGYGVVEYDIDNVLNPFAGVPDREEVGIVRM